GSDTELFFITGADALAQILTWKNVDELFSFAHFVGVSRPGHELQGDGLPVDRLSLVPMPALSISDTDCRQRVMDGAPVCYLVPDVVVQYITKYEMYRSENG